MEQQLLLMLLLFAYSLTILSFVISRNIVIRLFSAVALLCCAYIIGTDVFLYVGFGDNNVITYGTSQAGDPSRTGELYTVYLYGGMGLIQFIYSFMLMIDWMNVKIRGQAPMIGGMT